jgi:hypothetical protein
VTSRVTTPYTAQTTADDIVDGLDLTGRRIIVTGGAAGIGEKYFEDCNEALPNEPGTRRGVAAHALDPEPASRLWQVSQQTVGA